MPHKRVQAIEYDAEADVLSVEHFDTVEQAFAWCEAKRGAPLLAGDTEFGYQLQTEQERTDGIGFPPRWYEVHAVDEHGNIDYLEESDHEQGSFFQ